MYGLMAYAEVGNWRSVEKGEADHVRMIWKTNASNRQQKI